MGLHPHALTRHRRETLRGAAASKKTRRSPRSLGVWRCPDPSCERATWSEECDEIAPRAVFDPNGPELRSPGGSDPVRSRWRPWLRVRCGWATAMAAVRDHGQPRVDHLSRLGAPQAIGLDVTSFLEPGGAADAAGDRDRRPRHRPAGRHSAHKRPHLRPTSRRVGGTGSRHSVLRREPRTPFTRR